MEKLSSVMDIDSLADEFASKIQNPAILAKCFSNNKCNLLHSAFAWKDKIHLIVDRDILVMKNAVKIPDENLYNISGE